MLKSHFIKKLEALLKKVSIRLKKTEIFIKVSFKTL